MSSTPRCARAPRCRRKRSDREQLAQRWRVARRVRQPVALRELPRVEAAAPFAVRPAARPDQHRSHDQRVPGLAAESRKPGTPATRFPVCALTRRGRRLSVRRIGTHMLRLAALAAAGLVCASCSGPRTAGSLVPGGSQLARARAAQDTVIAAPPGWAATATRAATVPGAADNGPLAPSTPLTVRLGLNLHDVDQLKAAIAQGTVVSPQQFRAQYGASSGDVQSVVSICRARALETSKWAGSSSAPTAPRR